MYSVQCHHFTLHTWLDLRTFFSYSQPHSTTPYACKQTTPCDLPNPANIGNMQIRTHIGSSIAKATKLYSKAQ